MCRFALYLGPPITLDLLTTRPEYSIIRQSFQSRMREPLNGDGFGLAWYVPGISPTPAQFRSIQPAWNNINLLHLARVSVSPVVLAHVRAATPGFSVSEANCHPFIADRYAFMHNGSVPGFLRLKRSLRRSLSDEAYLGIHGTTDSEHLFALLRDQITQQTDGPPEARLAAAVRATIHEIQRLTESVGATEQALLNMVISDGACAVVSRCATGDGEAPTLYVRTGSRYVCDEGRCAMADADGRPEAILVASEPLTDEAGWQAVPPNHLLIIDSEFQYRMQPVD